LRIFSNEEFYQLRRKYFYKLILDEKMGLGEETEIIILSKNCILGTIYEIAITQKQYPQINIR
jgi:hypothetical protein